MKYFIIIKISKIKIRITFVLADNLSNNCTKTLITCLTSKLKKNIYLKNFYYIFFFDLYMKIFFLNILILKKKFINEFSKKS